ncbi:DEDD exonuclease domain-containing protein [Acidipropionibacterium virtanenii]|uniref:DNA polymerase III PolC-type n=1 Tax=Acidipropionibacterium virtanenii TaxID=2057246 RepID=A0A344UVD5_9ACTN|nr:DEDD exonuclease domain-containing protein [Acidipropionibacterium virtanenii]AXE39233.1 DNA polymerase III PolC-type [Acidipropionibacterium virtanenii]
MTAPDLQPSFDDLGTPLFEVTFCVVDLETTGGSTEDDITEIGAVKVRGGEVLGELATLVRPSGHIRGSVQMLTGITDEMVIDSPSIGAVLPSWLEFSRGCVLVAHNARFDMGFLRRACDAHDRPWPGNTVLDTLALARSCIGHDEVRDHRLGTLARYFSAATPPTHRALDDARATVDVMHGIIERVSGLGVTTLEDLLEVTHKVAPGRRARRTWADALPEGPGIYWFRAHRATSDEPPEVLYVGTSVNVRRRVRQYFTASETRRRMDEMVRVATGVDALACATTLEAGVRELRMIDAHSPRYNRRSRRQTSVNWICLSDDRYPRLSVVRSTSRADRTYWGPFSTRKEAAEAGELICEFAGIRQCTGTPASHPHGCPLAEMGRCAAPCLINGGGDDPSTLARARFLPEQVGTASAAHDPSTLARARFLPEQVGTAFASDDVYHAAVERAREAMTLDVRPLIDSIAARIASLSRQERFEDASSLTSRARSCLRASRRRARLASLADCAEIVAARPVDRTWEVHIVRHGRLAAAALSPAGENPVPTIDAARTTAETVTAASPGIPACTVEEAELVADWLESPGVRLVDIDGCWDWPLHCGADERTLARAVELANGAIAAPHECGRLPEHLICCHVQCHCAHSGQLEQDP